MWMLSQKRRKKKAKAMSQGVVGRLEDDGVRHCLSLFDVWAGLVCRRVPFVKDEEVVRTFSRYSESHYLFTSAFTRLPHMPV